MLEIVYTRNGDSILLDLRENGAFGKIYLRAHDAPPNGSIVVDEAGFDDEGDYEEAQLLHPVADSFSEFVASLGLFQTDKTAVLGALSRKQTLVQF